MYRPGLKSFVAFWSSASVKFLLQGLTRQYSLFSPCVDLDRGTARGSLLPVRLLESFGTPNGGKLDSRCIDFFLQSRKNPRHIETWHRATCTSAYDVLAFDETVSESELLMQHSSSTPLGDGSANSPLLSFSNSSDLKSIDIARK